MYLVNRTPHKALNGGLPEEAWSRRSVGLKHSWVFGCPAYILLEGAAQQSKLDAKSKKVFFIGYPYNTKGYMLYNPASHRE